METQQEQDLMILASAPTDQPLNDIELAALERERDREATTTPAHLSRRSETKAEASGNCQTSHSPLPKDTSYVTPAIAQADAQSDAGLRCAGRQSAELPWKESANHIAIISANGDRVCTINQSMLNKAANAAFIVRACNEYENLLAECHRVTFECSQAIIDRDNARAHAQRLAEELAVAKSQIENHDATLAQVRLNERHNAQRLADALNKTTARLDFVTRHSDFSTKDNDAIEQGRETLAQWEGVKS